MMDSGVGKKRKGRARRGLWRKWFRRIAIAVVVLFAAILGSIVLFRFVNPPITTVMVAEKLSGETLKRRWVPLSKISPQLRLAVIASEDGNFCRHRGVDWAAVREVVSNATSGRPVRGASTIPMQVAKNLYLWEYRSYLRKALEVPLAYAMVTVWSKPRVLEVYLNIAQWGPGLFGAEAASRYYFGKPASALTRRQAALLAAALPNPNARNPRRPSRVHLQIARKIESRIPTIAKRADCVLTR